MAENLDIQQRINSYLTSHSELKGKSEEVILSAMIEEGAVTQAEIDAAKSTSAFGFGFGENGDLGLAVESEQSVPNGISKLKDENGNDIVLKYNNGLLMEKTISKNNIQSAKTTYTYAGNGCIIAETQNNDRSKTVVIGNSVDENGNIPDEDFICSETTNKNGESSSVYMTYYGMVKQEIKNNIESTTIYATSNYSEVKNKTAQKISETKQNTNGNGVLTKYNTDGTLEKYTQIILVKDETLSEIALKYGTSIEEIKKLNPSIENLDKIKIGTPILLENKSNVPDDETVQRKVQQQIVYEGYEKAYNNILTKQNKNQTISFPIEINGKQSDKFNSLQDAAKYVLKLNQIKNPTKEQLDVCVKELAILNSSGEEKSLNKRAKSALDNINNGTISYTSMIDHSAVLKAWGFEPTPENYVIYQQYYAVLDSLNELSVSSYSALQNETDKNERIKLNNEVMQAREIRAKIDELLYDNGKKDPDTFKYRMLTECGINFYGEDRAQEAEDILKRKTTLSLYSSVNDYIYRRTDNVVNSGSLTEDIKNNLQKGYDAVAHLFGGDFNTNLEYLESLGNTQDFIDNVLLKQDLRKGEEFNQTFKSYFGVEYNKENIDKLMQIIENFKNEDEETYFVEALKDKEFRKIFKETFNYDLKDDFRFLNIEEWGSKITDIMIMVVAFQVIAKSPAMQNFSMRTGATLNNIGLTGKTLQTLHAAIVSGTSFATYTAAEKAADLMLRQEELNPNNSEKIAENIFETFAFGSFAGAFNALAIAPLTQQKTVQYALEEVEKSMAEGSVKTGAEVMQLFYNAQAPVISSKIGQAAYTFGANVAGFTSYNTAKDMIENMDKVKEIGFGKYLGKQFLAQLQGLATFEGVKYLIAFAMTGKFGAGEAKTFEEAMNSGITPEELGTFLTLNNMTVEPINNNGKTGYKVSYPSGQATIIDGMGELVGLCQQWMVAEHNLAVAYNSKTQTNTPSESTQLAIEAPKSVTPEISVNELVKPQTTLPEENKKVLPENTTPALLKPVAEPLTKDIVLNQLRSLGTNEELIESFARNIDNGYINLETCKDLFLAVKDDPEILTDYFGLLMFEGLRPENISAKIEIYEALKDSKIRPIDKSGILFKTEQGNIEEVRQEVSFRKHLEELYDENIDLQNRRDVHFSYLNACTQHNGYEFVNNNLELIIRNLGIAYYIREENLPLARAIDEYTIATKKELEPRRIEEIFSSSAEQQTQIINELHQELVKLEEINGKLERQERISRDEAAQMIGLIFPKEPGIISQADDILKYFNNDGLISADAIKLIKQLKEYFEQNSQYTAYIPGDVKILLEKTFNNGRIATEEEITSLSKLIQISQTENPADDRIELYRYIQAIQKADGSLDGSKVEQAIESGLTISECLNIFDNFSRYDIFTNKYSNDIEGYNKALEIAIALSDQSPEMRNFFIKYFSDKSFESYTDFTENPGETVKFIEKFIELGFLNKDSYRFRDGIMMASLPIEPVQLKALELLSGIKFTDSYISPIYKYLDSIQESELPVIKDILNKYASNLSLYQLESIREISKFYANSNSEIQEALIKAVHKGVFEYGHNSSFCSKMDFLNALQTRPKAITALLNSNIKCNNIYSWRFLLEFLEGDPTPISDEQASFYFGLISKTPLASEIRRYDLCTGAIYRALISLDPKYYGEIEDLVLSGADPIATIVSVNKAVAKNPNAISETKLFIANNPQIAEILEGHTSLILENIDNIKLLAHRPDIVKGLFDDGMLEDIIGYEGITAEIINRSIQAADKISPETKSIIPSSSARVFSIQAYVEAFGGGNNKKGLAQSFVDAHNKLATYDLNFANGVSDLIFSHMKEFVNAGKINNIDYIYNYVVNEGDSEEFILKALLIETDMYELESYCKELNLDTDAKNALILDIMNISILQNNIDIIRLDEKIDWYNKLQNIDDVQRYICSRVGIDVDNIISKLQSMIGSPRDVITTPIESQRGFLHDIIANNNQVAENILKTMNFESFGKSGLPLKYSREEFTANIIKLLENLSSNEQELILRHFYLEKGQKGFDGIPTNLPFNEEGASDEVKAVAHMVQQEINKFSLENEVVTGDPTVDKIFTSLIQGLPEFTSIVGKEQHDTHSYSVDIHSLKVLQSAMNNPLYQQLSDQDKTILKFAILLHDTGKKGGVRDAGHASLSAEFVAGILEKYPFTDGVKDRIVDIVENHHWFEGYNKGITSPAEVAIHCRRPEDYLIYQIFAKADLENVNSTFHYVVTGTSTPEEYAAFMQDKTQAIGQALQQLYSKSNLIFDTKFVRKGELFPLESATVNGTEMQFRVLDLNKIDDNASLQAFGFEPGTTKSNARFFVHMTNPNREDMEPVKILTGNSLNGSTWSTSLIQPHNNRTYQDRRFGFILDVDQSNISSAYYENIGSGCGKSIKDFEDFIFASDNLPERMFVRSSLIELLKEREIELSDEEYAALSKEMISKKYIHQIKDDIVIGDKTIKPEVLTECLEISRDRLFEGGNIHSEIIPINPRIIGLVAKVENLSECPEEFLEFAHENNLPIIIMKEEHEN